MMAIAPLMLSLALLAPNAAPGQVMAGQDIAGQVQRELQGRLVAAGSSARLELAGRLSDVTLPAGPVAVEIGTISGRWPRAKAGVPVRIAVNGRTARNLTVWLTATDQRSVLTYADSYAPGAAQQSLRTQTAVVDMTCCEGVPAAAQQLEGTRLRRAVRAGSPVLLADLEPMPVVNAQQKVAVAVERGAVRIITAGVAMQDGGLGDRIAVRPEHSQHTVAARVVAAGEVIIDE